MATIMRYTGLFYAPVTSRFGAVPPSEEALLEAYFDDAVGADRSADTALFARALAYNTRRTGTVKLGGRTFELRRDGLSHGPARGVVRRPPSATPSGWASMLRTSSRGWPWRWRRADSPGERLVEMAALLGEAIHREVRWLEVFGRLIANSDMHQGNLSLWLDDVAIAGGGAQLRHAADAVRRAEQRARAHGLHAPLPSPADADVAHTAHAAALAFWRAVAGCDDVSSGFRAIARDNAGAVEALGPGLA